MRWPSMRARRNSTAGIATRLDCVPFSIVVNRAAERFYDEGEDFWPKRYAIWGRLVAKQADQVGLRGAGQRSALEDFMPSIFPPESRRYAWRGWRSKLGLDPAALKRTVEGVQRGLRGGGALRSHHRMTGGGPVGAFARQDELGAADPSAPPFYGYPLRPGITFTYLGVAVDEEAKVAMSDGRPAANIWAAGEIMAGNILGQGYLAGIGMTIGSVFGRIAGERAARYVRN